MIFVVNSLNLGQAGLVGIKLCEILKILEQTSRDSNQVTNQLIRLFLLTNERLAVRLLANQILSSSLSIDPSDPGIAGV